MFSLISNLSTPALNNNDANLNQAAELTSTYELGSTDMEAQSIFENSLEALLNPIVNQNSKMENNVNKINAHQLEGEPIDTTMLLELQKNTTDLNTAVTVASKTVNLAVKGINQLTQLQ